MASFADFMNKSKKKKKDDDIAPVREDVTPAKEDKNFFELVGETVSDGFVQLGDALSDGYDFGDITKTILGTDADIATDLASGVVGWGEKAIDAGATLAGNVTEKLGWDGATKKIRDFAEKDLYDENEVARKILSSPVATQFLPGMQGVAPALKAIYTLDDWLNRDQDNSFLGEKGNSTVASGFESVAKRGIQAATGGIPVGDIITGVTTFGAQAEEALKEDATFAQAGGSGLISAGAEIIFEKLSGGIKIGGVALDDGLRRIIGKNITNVAAKTALNMGLDIVGEGAEEVATEFFSKLGTKLYKEEDLGEILASEDALKDYIGAFISGGAMGGAFNAAGAVSGIKNKTDYKTDLSENEQKVVNKEYENRLAEKKGEKLSLKDKAKIYEEVMKDMREGNISIDTIEEVLGGDDYKTYKDTVANEESLSKELQELRQMKSSDMNDIQRDRLAELKGMDLKTSKGLKSQLEQKTLDTLAKERNGKGSYLMESYNERERRGQAFGADLSQYSEKQREIVQKAIDSGVLNNTRKVHKLVDLVAKVYEDKGVSFDFTSNEKLKNSSLSLNGKTVNGYVDANGNIVLNANSAKMLNTVVGHEIAHILEGTETYGELANIIKAYAKDYDSRLARTKELYKDVYKDDLDAKAEQEVIADLVGDYLFTNSDFVNHLSTQNRNLFQKIYDEIKYLCKVATAGSKEARELEKVKKAFDKAYREGAKTQKSEAKGNTKGNTKGDTKYSVSEATGTDYLSAVERGDMNTAQKMVDEAAKNAGYTVKAYHGTPIKGITVFDDAKIGSTTDDGIFGHGFYFSTNKLTADGYATTDGATMPTFLRVEKPWWGAGHTIGEVAERLDLSESMLTTRKVGGRTSIVAPLAEHSRAFASHLKERGYDSVIVQHGKGDYEIVIFDNASIKSADPVTYDNDGNVIPLSERFKSDNNDIRFSLSETDEGSKKDTDIPIKDRVYYDSFEGSYKYNWVVAWNGGDSYGNIAPATSKTKKSGEDWKTEIRYPYLSGPFGSFTTDHWDGNTRAEMEQRAAEWLEENGFEYSKSNHWNHKRIFDAVHINTKKAYEEAKAAQEAKDKTGEPGYLRFGDVPKGGKSFNYRDNFYEKGTSVYKALFYPDGTYKILANNPYLLFGSKTYADRPAYRVYGEEVGVGSDGEPVLNVSRVQRIGDDKTRYSLSEGEAPATQDYLMQEIERVGAEREAIQNEAEQLNRDAHAGVITWEEYRERVAGFSKRWDELNAEWEKLMDAVEVPTKATETDPYAPMTEDEANAWFDEAYENLGAPDAPVGTPYIDPEDVAPVSPFENRDIKAVGNQKVKAYMYENPEVKPFFQKEAEVMLGELERSERGERWFNDEVYYETNGEAGIGGTSRQTTADIAYLLDEQGYTYAEIEKGLKAIIEDNGAENNACSKRIEFLLNDRLMNGHEDIDGMEIPADQDYLNLLAEKQITEYSQEAREKVFAEPAVAPELVKTEIVDDIGPANVESQAQATTDGELTGIEGELAENRRRRAESFASYNQKIEKWKAEYDAKRNKDTKAANDLLRKIARAERFRDGVDEDYAKRIRKLELMTAGKPTVRQELHRGIVDGLKAKFADKGFDFDEVLRNAKDLSTLATVDNTPQRVMEKALGNKEGRILADETVNKVTQNETAGITWLNSYTDRKGGLLAKISKQYHIKPGSKESAAAQMFAEGFYVNDKNEIIGYGVEELAKDFPDAQVRENIIGLATDERIRQIYDETLAMINESRARNAYPEIQKLDNYFLYFRAMDDTFSKLGLPFNPNDIRAKDLPTDLNGVTADLKPGQPFFASAMHRKGLKTSYDLLGGLERYLSSAKNQIYHIDDIQTLRALRNYIADTYGQANGLEGLDTLTEEEAQERIKQVYDSHLSTFAKFLNEEANVLAGKTALIDRGLEGIIGRRGITTLDTINKQVGANMVGWNVSSALTNLLAQVQAFAKTNKAAFVKGYAQTISNKIKSLKGKGDGFAETSPVCIRRKGADRFHRTPFQKVSDAGYALAGAVDEFSTEVIARAKYNELTAKGMDSEKAHIETDKWVSRLMGDRSLGQMPQLYNSKMLGLFTKFQLEVRNQLDSQFYDTIQDAKLDNAEIENKLKRNSKIAAKVTAVIAAQAVTQHLFGKAFEAIAGYNPAFDIISVIMTAFGLDDDEESEDTALDNVEQAFIDLLEDLPYTSMFTGGRIPIASALPIKELVTGKDEYGNEVSRWKTAADAAPYYILPGGYGQIKKTAQGLSMFLGDHPVAGSYTDSGNLRFPVEPTVGNVAQAAVFGQWANENAREYFDNDIAPLNEKYTQEYIDSGMDIQDYWKYRNGVKKYKTIAEKKAYIDGLNLTPEQKQVLIDNLSGTSSGTSSGRKSFSDFVGGSKSGKKPKLNLQ